MSHDDARDELQALRRRVAELEKYQEDSELLDALLRSFPDFVYFKNRNRQFVRASETFAAMFRRPLSEILGRRDEELFPPEVAAESAADDHQVIEGKERIIDRIEGGVIEGQERWVSTTKVPWHDRDGQLQGVMGISRDISTSKARLDAIQDEAERGQRMEALGQLAGGVAHDFNNVLMVISGSASQVLEDLPDDHACQEDLQIIHEATRRAAALTRQLLTFSRNRIGHPRAVRPADLLRSLEVLVSRLLPDDIVLTTELASDDRVYIDPVQFEQVVLNLALNARDAMKSGGTVAVRIEDRAFGGRRGVRLTVRDSGDGLSRDEIKRIFEPFYSTKAPGVGTGLGLATVKRIVNEAGGDICVDSSPGEGTTMYVWLPATTVGAQASTAAPTFVAPAACSVLLVDDDESVRRTVRRMLERRGLRVFTASGIEDGMAWAKQHRVDILIADVILRSGTGLDLADSLHELQPDARVLFISGFPSDVFERRGLDPQRFGILPKPFLEHELWEKLNAEAAPS